MSSGEAAKKGSVTFSKYHLRYLVRFGTRVRPPIARVLVANDDDVVPRLGSK